MITCQACGHENQLGTIFCHKCGTRIEVAPDQILGSVMQSAKVDKSDATIAKGRGLLGLAVFLLAVALAASLLVPDIPPADVPLAPARSGPELLPARVNAAATTAGGVADLDDLLPSVPSQAVSMGSVLDWRARHAIDVLGRLDPAIFATIRNLQREVLQHSERQLGEATGRFVGDDPIAATALAVLALQALPGDPVVDQTAERGRAELRQHLTRIRRGMDSATRVLLIAALAEANELDDASRERARTMLTDGESAKLQALALARIPASLRPPASTVARRLVDDGPWPVWTSLLQGEAASLSDAQLMSGGLSGIDRYAWISAAWFGASNPQRIAETLNTWAAGSIPDHGVPELTSAGEHANAAVAILALTAPIALPIRDLSAPID